MNTNVDLGLEIGVIARPIDITLYPSLFDFQTQLLSESANTCSHVFYYFQQSSFYQTGEKASLKGVFDSTYSVLDSIRGMRS